MRKEYLFFLVIPLSQILMLFDTLKGERRMNFWGYGGLFLSIAADILLLFILIRSSRREKLNRELQELTYLQETERMQNEMLEAKQQKMLSTRLEFEKRLEKIQEKLKRGEEETAWQEMDEFQKSLEKTRPASYCQNSIINAVVHEKEKDLKRLQVQMDIRLQVPQMLKLDPLHLCSIFSNLLDNALEALSGLPQEERKFELHAEIKGVYLFVRCRNTASKSHALRKRRKGHGYGTQILDYIAKTYEGSYQAGYENGWYTAAVMVKAE